MVHGDWSCLKGIENSHLGWESGMQEQLSMRVCSEKRLMFFSGEIREAGFSLINTEK